MIKERDYSQNKANTVYGILFFAAGILSVLCFPVNPLVLFGIVRPYDIRVFEVIGYVIWACGMFLIGFAYYFIYMRRSKGFIRKGIYRIIRHPMYLGWILSVFTATVFIYQHWVFIVMGIPGAVSVYLISRLEDRDNIKSFGSAYRDYMREVPPINIISGLIRSLRNKW